MAKRIGFSGNLAQAAVLGLVCMSAQSGMAAARHLDCKVYEQQEQASVEAQKRADPAIREERFNGVFWSPARQTCVASVYFVKGSSTYGGIYDISAGRLIWAKGYRGTRFTPAHIVAMDREMDDQILAFELPSSMNDNSKPFDFVPTFLDRTMNNVPVIRNYLAEQP